MSTCPRCQREFDCACQPPEAGACWCATRPILKISSQADLPRPARACYCPTCFDDLLKQQQDQLANRADTT